MTEQINTADAANTSNNSIEERKSVERMMPAGHIPPIIMDTGCGVIKAGLASEERPSVVLNNM